MESGQVTCSRAGSSQHERCDGAIRQVHDERLAALASLQDRVQQLEAAVTA